MKKENIRHKLPEYTPSFVYSSDLQISQDSQIVMIRKIYKHRWLYATSIFLMWLLCLFFIGVITIMAIREKKPTYLVGILLLSVIAIRIFYSVRKTLLSKELLTLDLVEKTITFQKSNRQRYYYYFDEVEQWLLVGKVNRQYRGGRVATTQLYLKVKKNPIQNKPLEIFLFTPTLDFKTTVSAGYHHYMHLMKKNAKEKGQEVVERLQEFTQIPWHWQDYGIHNTE